MPSSSPFTWHAENTDYTSVNEHMSQDDRLRLREQYEQEELDRFILLFSDYIKEVRVPNSSQSANQLSDDVNPSPNTKTWGLNDANDVMETTESDPRHNFTRHDNVSDAIALGFVEPMLPPFEHQKPPDFTVPRFRLTVQRLLIATLPLYGPLYSRLKHLATWEHPPTSLFWCTVFWALWFQGLLLPALLTRILIAHINNSLKPYPHDGAQLMARRADVARAQAAGEALFDLSNLAEGGASGAAYYTRMKVQSKLQKSKSNEETDATWREGTQDIPQILLTIVHEVADLHERINNLLLWRRPSSSRFYAWVLAFCILVCVATSTTHITKFMSALGGAVFWHVVPVVLALPPSARTRLPRPFGSVPTDIDHAIQLMADRVARGQDVHLNSSAPGTGAAQTTNRLPLSAFYTAKWRKMKRLLRHNDDSLKNDTRDEKSDSPQEGPSNQLSFTYVAQHSRGAGRLELNSHTVLFIPIIPLKPSTIAATATSVMHKQDSHESEVEDNAGNTKVHNKTLSILLSRVKSIKKSDILGAHGLVMTWEDEEGCIQKERFWWIQRRDEAFARIVGGQRRWVRE